MIKLSNFFVGLFYLLVLIAVLTVTSIGNYFFCGAILIWLVYLKGGFRNFIRCGALFNIFFIFFVFIGVLGNNLLRGGYNHKIGVAVLLSIWCFNLPYILIGYNDGICVTYRKLHRVTLSVVCNLFVLFGIIMGSLYYLIISTIPLLSADSVGERIAAISGAGIYLYSVRAGVYASIIFYLIDKSKRHICTFLLLNLMLLGTSFRGEFMQNFLLLGFVSINYRGIQVSKIKMFMGGVVVIVVIFLLSFLRDDYPDLNSVIFKFINMESVGVYVLDLVFNGFNNFQNGATFFFGIGSIFHISTEFTQWLTQQLPMDFDGGVTPTIVGDFYINFANLFWVPFILLGYFSQRIDYKLAFQENNIFNILILTNLTICIARSVSGGVSNMFLMALFSTLFFIMISFLTKINLGRALN